jgi:glycosyltransferase involved in cell wall biosynthesis
MVVGLCNPHWRCPKMLISILICTKDRPQQLRETLEAIVSLELPADGDYELIVVDNGSKSEGTAQLCREMEPAFKSRLHFSALPLPGKSRAANAGFKMSRGEIIAFLDDDILPRRDWLSAIYREFSSHPELGGISGRVELRDAEDLQVGVRRKEERATYESPMDSCNLFIGCNFAVRRAVIEEHGLYDPLFGPGSWIGSAEDLDFCYRAWKTGEMMVYEPSMFVLHAHGRRSAEDGAAIKRAYVVGKGAFFAKYVLSGDTRIAKEMYWEVRSGARDVFRSGGGRSLRHLAWLATGFLKYPLARLSGRGGAYLVK